MGYIRKKNHIYICLRLLTDLWQEMEWGRIKLKAKSTELILLVEISVFKSSHAETQRNYLRPSLAPELTASAIVLLMFCNHAHLLPWPAWRGSGLTVDPEYLVNLVSKVYWSWTERKTSLIRIGTPFPSYCLDGKKPMKMEVVMVAWVMACVA